MKPADAAASLANNIELASDPPVQHPHHASESFSCPNCGAEVSTGKSFCRACGASDDSGWGNDESSYDAGYTAEDDFDYDEFLEREFPDQAERRPPSAWRVGWIVVAILLLLAIVLLTVL